MHRRFTTKGLGRRWCAQLLLDNWWIFWHDHIVLTVYTALMMATWWMISHMANSAKPFSYCFSKQSSPVLLITVDVFFHAQTLQFSYHKTVKAQSYVTTPVSSHLLSTLLAWRHLPRVKTKVPEQDNADTWVISEQQLLQSKQFVSGVQRPSLLLFGISSVCRY